MADFCVKCHQKMNAGIHWVLREHPWEYELEEGICEGCGQYRDDLVVGLHPSWITRRKQKKRYLKEDHSTKK